MKTVEFQLGTWAAIVVILVLLGGGFMAGKASVKKDVCTLVK